MLQDCYNLFQNSKKQKGIFPDAMVSAIIYSRHLQLPITRNNQPINLTSQSVIQPIKTLTATILHSYRQHQLGINVEFTQKTKGEVYLIGSQ